MVDKQTDIALIDEVKKGNKKAFNLLVAKYQNKIANVLLKFLDINDVPDIAQETFIKAYQSISSFKGDSMFYTWLYRIAVNTAKNHLMANKNKPKNDILVDEVENFEEGAFLRNIETPENLFVASRLKDRVLTVIDNLPVELKQVIVYREIDEMDYEQIATKLNIPIGTVRSRLSRAREIIEQKIKNYL